MACSRIVLGYNAPVNPKSDRMVDFKVKQVRFQDSRIRPVQLSR
jgi:hypothetical protein